MNEQRDKRTDGNGRMDGWVDRHSEEQKDQRKDAGTGGRTNGWMVGRMELMKNFKR